MFTGIVKEIGTVYEISPYSGVFRIRIFAPNTAKGLRVGESIAINGTCLSAVNVDKGVISFEVIPETRRFTNLGKLTEGSHVNVEPSLCFNERLGGHLVLGHVDGLGKVSARKKVSGELELVISVPKRIRDFLIPKGPITVDGVSLTVGQEVSSRGFSVYLIPETLSKTNLGQLKAGSLVNIEIDYVAKLIRQFYFKR